MTETPLPKLSSANLDLLRAVAADQVTYMLGSPIQGMSKTAYYRRADASTKPTAPMKKLREAGLVRHGSTRGMTFAIELTDLGQQVLVAQG